ncbi:MULTISPECIES: hypothetical protein [Shouchella]|uniref:Uncharacterized protein n=2 Tax=Shouchella TaxID=2893057 RepID=A0ABY7W9I4_9BACI|nr:MULTISPECIES: hypothetical protein [Shouchella]MED4130634.1 hypothetical protein [Shouchella miscanthi]WDF04213.1 hypothetical protein PQ477_01670 [Shouchella hunanensis]GAF21274.1 hypothetical protein JCM19047_950 [Bacillus sp. JCM 19047]
MKQRGVICLLLACIMGAYAFEHLPFKEAGLSQVFAYSWVGFCLLVVVGNGLAVLKAQRLEQKEKLAAKAANRKKLRQYG